MICRKCLFILLPLIIWGCQDREKTAQLTEINNMNKILDSLDNVTQNQNADSNLQVVKSIKATIEKVKEYYIADTIDLNLAAMMNSYKDAQKVLSSNTGNLAKAKDAIPEVQEKLGDLEHDIKNGVGNREKYVEYINFEKNKIKEIQTLLDYYITTNIKYLDKYKSVHPKVQSFADSLEMQNEE